MISYLKSKLLLNLNGKYYIPLKYYLNKLMGSLEKEIDHLPTATCATSVAIDVGANKGSYSYALLKRGFKVVSLEPSEQFSKILTEFSSANSRSNYVKAAASDFDGTVTLFRSGDSEDDDSLSSIINGSNAKSSSEVHATMIDTLLLKNVEFIKIDVEGAEFLVKKGALDTLRQRPTLLVEIEKRHHKDRSLADLIDSFCPEGYTPWYLCDKQWKSITELKQNDIESLQSDSDIHAPTYVNNFLFLPK